MKKANQFKIPKGSLKSLLLKLTFIFACTTLFVCIAYYISQNTEYEYTKTEKTSVYTTASAKTEATLCTLALENGRLVIYYPNGTKEYANMDIHALTEYDTRLLTNGICADKNEIYEIIESLMS